MKPNEVIKTMLAEDNMRQCELAELAGMKTAGQLSVTLRSDMRISTFITLIESMGGEVEVTYKDKRYHVGK